VRVWRQNDGPEIFAIDPRAQSDSITAVQVPEGYDADKVRQAS
jgi:alanine-glyoxylate transaminase/serine-glyoxylate transaminase/serine-pyruvate transaminase